MSGKIICYRKDNIVIQRAKNGLFTKENMFFWAPIVVYLSVACVIIHISISTDFSSLWDFLGKGSIFLGMSTMVVLAYISIFIEPSVENSRKKLYDLAFRVDKNGETVSGRFHKMKYTLDKKKIKIYKINIKYQGHEKDSDFIDLFGKKEYEYKDKDDLIEFVVDRSNKQVEYIRNAFESCAEAKRQSIIKFD